MINKAEVSEFLSHLELPVDEKNCGPCGSVDIVRDSFNDTAKMLVRTQRPHSAS